MADLIVMEYLRMLQRTEKNIEQHANTFNKH